MTRKLVLIHGRSQQNKDASALKQEWLDALGRGLAKSGLNLPIGAQDIVFPYYGDTLDQLSRGLPPEQAADVILRGKANQTAAVLFAQQVAEELFNAGVISRAQAEAMVEQAVRERGILQWEWVQKILAAVDRHVPGASGASIALATHDVYCYLSDEVIRRDIDNGVARALAQGGEAVVVSHSLGTVVAFRVLRERGQAQGWRVPLFVTLGSPLAVTAIRERLANEAPLRCPPCAGAWFNAMDRRDIVALYALDANHLPLSPAQPAVHNKLDVDNDTENRHGISGYLQDAEVARRIHEALVA